MRNSGRAFFQGSVPDRRNWTSTVALRLSSPEMSQSKPRLRAWAARLGIRLLVPRPRRGREVEERRQPKRYEDCFHRGTPYLRSGSRTKDSAELPLRRFLGSFYASGGIAARRVLNPNGCFPFKEAIQVYTTETAASSKAIAQVVTGEFGGEKAPGSTLLWMCGRRQIARFAPLECCKSSSQARREAW